MSDEIDWTEFLTILNNHPETVGCCLIGLIILFLANFFGKARGH